MSLSLNHRNLTKFLWSFLTTKLWNICSVSAVTATCSQLNHISTPSKLLFKSLPVRSTSFNEILRCEALESNRIQIWPGLCGWYMLKMGRYQHSSSLCSGGANSAWSGWKISCMKARKWYFISGFLSRVQWRLSQRMRPWSLSLGRRGIGMWKGRQATQLLASSMNISLSISWINCLSSIDSATLSSSSVLLKILLLRGQSPAFWTGCQTNKSAVSFSFKMRWEGHRLKWEWRSFSRTLVRYLLTPWGLCAAPRFLQLQPKQGQIFGHKGHCLAHYTGLLNCGLVRPRWRSICAPGSRSGMRWAMHLRWVVFACLRSRYFWPSRLNMSKKPS